MVVKNLLQHVNRGKNKQTNIDSIWNERHSENWMEMYFYDRKHRTYLQKIYIYRKIESSEHANAHKIKTVSSIINKWNKYVK